MADHNLKAVLPPNIEFFHSRFEVRPDGFEVVHGMFVLTGEIDKSVLTADSAIIYGATIFLTQESLDHFLASTS